MRGPGPGHPHCHQRQFHLVRQDRPRGRDVRNRDGWSGPTFIRTGGIGFGAQIAANVTEFVLVLNTLEAVQAFACKANVKLGGELSVAAVSGGRSTEAGVTPTAALYAFSRSHGLFAGVSLEGSVIGANINANRR